MELNCRTIILCCYIICLVLFLSSSISITKAKEEGEEDRSSSSIISRFQEYLQINTAQPNPKYNEAAKFILSQAQSLSLEAQTLEFVEAKPFILLKWSGSDPNLPSILLNSHTDVVPVEHDKWSHPPFGAHIDSQGNIYARGSQDMKCVGMQYLEAIRKLKASGFQPLRSVYLSFVPDEEIGGDAGVKKFADTHVFNNLNVGIVLDEGLASPTENYRVFYAERSAWWLVIKAIGQPGHGSKLYDNSAMENLFKSIESVRRFRASQFDLVRAGLKDEGEVVSVNMAFLKAGTPSPTGFVMNLQPSEAQAGFDIRVPPTADPESLERRITEEWAPASRNMTFEFKQKNTVHDNFGKPLLTATDSSNPWWALLEEAVRKANGKIGKPEIFPAATDSHFFRKRGFLAIGFSPMANTPILLHDHNEFLNQDEYLKGIDVYVSIIKAYASYAEHTRKEGSKDELQIGETSLNEASSRSHQILRLTIESSAREFLGNDKSSSLTATVNFVDLAGSERASQSLAAGARLKEGCHINRSLLTLGTVIRKLSKGRNGHIPFRDSKLTRILQSSLGGNARTAIICTMSPARSHVEQSRNTLLFASCAKEVATNAQVNVVMSDKALVKHLQRELSRLETELRSSGTTTVTSDSSALVRERDLLVEKLKKEIKELTLQRDLAQSQVKDLLRLVSDDSPALVLTDPDHHYPKLRVRTSWDFENQISETAILAVPHSLDVGLRSFDASQYSDGHSSSTDDNLFQLPHFEENFVQTNSSPRLSVTVPTFVGTHQYQEETEEQTDGKSEDLCKEVRCIEMEEPSTNQYEDSSPKRYVNSNMLDSSLNRYVNSNMSSPAANTATSGVTVVDNGGSANQELGSHSPPLKEDKVLNSFVPDFVVPSPEKASPWLMEKDTPSSNCLRLTRSRSCKARLMTSYMPWFEKVEKHENTPPIWFEKDFTGRPEGLQMKLSTLNYGAIIDKLSRSNSQTSMGSAAVDELKVQDAKSSSDQNSVSRSTSIAGMSEMVDRQSENQHHDHAVLEMEPKPTASIKNVKDVGLDPMQDDPGSPSKWPSEFKRLQKEIIGLWNACNISLVHRTYFFLLFKGDPADSIYMEVELRRLSFLKDIFSRGSQTVENGRTLTPTSSMRALRCERQMLSHQMKKKLSKQDRHNLYLKWGIGLNSKHRRLQLVHRLWTDTRDIDHIAQSACVVAKLVGSVEPEQAFKEMFGLNFTPRPPSRSKYRRWKPNVKALL